MVIQLNEFNYEEVKTQGLFDTRDSSESDAIIADLLEKKSILNEGYRGLKREHEIQSMRLCEVTKQKKKGEEEKVMVEEDKRQMAIRIEERPSDV